ncbi:MAG TPA: hypothetical protein VNU01_10010, partial [Egibacteraceae bacterium]|nr:hypothetical protein [Egibacteraceae bacterium]
TGKRVNIPITGTPRNVAGKPIDPAEQNRNDGFSPGALIVSVVPGVDLARTGAPDLLGGFDDSLAPDSPIVLLNADTGERHPFWAELDEWDQYEPGQERPLLIRPAVNFTEGHRYIVALRDMKDAAGGTIQPNEAFAKILEPGVPGRSQGRDRHFEDEIFPRLAAAGVGRDGMYLAWDFTVASAENLAGRVLHMRDDAFATLGDAVPAYEVTGTFDNPSSQIARRVEGAVKVPNYLTLPGGAPGSNIRYGADGKPEQFPGGGTMDAKFWCNIPASASPSNPSRISLYGHGLLGSGSQVSNGYVRDYANRDNITFCGVDWIGMSTEDLPVIGAILADMSLFSKLPDRAQQGFVNFMFVGRALKHPQGFVTDPAFQPTGEPLLDTGELFYDGNSQGGIMGGALMALTQDVTRGVLGVPGQNYSTLLDRSVDWEPYYAVFDAAYPDRLEQQIVFSMIQMLWDRGEANGYAAHITHDPYPGTPSHQVLLQAAYGDHQVTIVAAEVMARTIGAYAHQPQVAKHYDAPELWGLEQIPYGSDTGAISAMTLWDHGNDPIPLGNVPPTTDRYDPHGLTRREPRAMDQKSAFMRTGGSVINVCDVPVVGGPCIATERRVD